jgi:dienelactone hydrolase
VARIAIVFGSVAALTLAGAAYADREITMDMVRTVLPEEGAPRAVPGPYEVVSEPAFGSPGHVVFRPANLDAFPAKDTLPVMVWGNGGCAINSTRYAGFFSTIASHGFLVLATAAVEGEPRRQANADDMRAALDWADAENARAGSPLVGKIATRRMAVMGQSCGGFMSIEAGGDPRVGTVGVFNAGVRPPVDETWDAPWPPTKALAFLRGPVLLVNGGKPDFMLESSKATFHMIDDVPVFYGSRHGAGHTATVDHPGGGEFANVASNWLLWTLKGDEKAGAMFVGDSCSLCTDSNWDVMQKRLE